MPQINILMHVSTREVGHACADEMAGLWQGLILSCAQRPAETSTSAYHAPLRLPVPLVGFGVGERT